MVTSKRGNLHEQPRMGTVDAVTKLPILKTLYGRKQSGREWNFDLILSLKNVRW